jgi:hypothetical protein
LEAGARGTPDHPEIFAGHSGFLQVIIILKKAEKAVSNPFLLCWHGESLAGSTNSVKPKPFG